MEREPERKNENEFAADKLQSDTEPKADDEYVPASQQTSGDDSFENDEDLSWIDKLIKDIEEEQKNNN